MKNENGLSRYAHFWGPIHLVTLSIVIMFASLIFQYGEFDLLPIVLSGTLIVLIYFVGWVITYYHLGDPYIWTIVSMLVSLSLAMQFRLSPVNGVKQFNWVLVGVFTFLISYMLYSKFHERFRSVKFHYALLVSLFLITFFFGTEINGARNWILIGPYSFQPSEFSKLVFVFFMAACVTSPECMRFNIRGKDIPPRMVMMALVFILLGFFALQREFGTALLVFGVYLTFVYVFEKDLLFSIYNLCAAGVLGFIALKTVSHLQVRIDAWVDPWADAGGKGYQITQSLFSIGSGGFFGSGLGLGYPKYIPAVSTDFIFAAFCEETGILGGIAIIMLFYILVYRGIKIALRLEDRFMKAVAFGLTLTYGFQTFIIIGGVIKVIPLTGITLPFLSYGGSSMVASFVGLGILQALSGQILRKEAVNNEVGYRQ